jgi:signal transduction histidine kinase
MSFIQNLFKVNHDIIFFIYGLVFFVVGLAIALQSRHSSRLDLARNLTWLAAFGFLHGFHEWGDLFIPIQAAYLSPALISVLHYVHLFLLVVSFACLFEFGVALLEPLKRKWPHFLAPGLLMLWFLVVFIPLRIWQPDFDTWHKSADALGRYFIGLPGGLMAAFSLRRHTLQRIAPFNVPQIVKAIQAAGVAMALYGLAAGLVVPPVNFFPGNLINTDTFTRLLVVPPQLVRALIGLAIAGTTIRMLEIFDVETSRQIEAMEQQQMLAAERERIARELHDGTIQKVYTAGLLVRAAQNLATAETPLAGRLSTAVGVLDDAIGDLRENLSSLHSPPQAGKSLASAIRELASDPRFSSLVDVSLNVNLPESDGLTPEREAHVLAIVREAIANTVRHSKARHVRLKAERVDNRLKLVIEDDGVGIPNQVMEGHGLRNMRDRASLLHGRLDLYRLDRGTSVELDIPWKEGA